MSRACGFKKTASGKPCEQIVEDHHDHCEAGHPCPPVKTDPSAGTEKLQASSSSSSLEIDELVAPLVAPVQSPAVEALKAEAKAAAELAYGKQTEEYLRDSLGPDSDFGYQGTVRGEHPGGHRYKLALFASQGVSNHLARGRMRWHAWQKQWYLVTTCHDGDDEHSCDAPAYVRLKSAQKWYGKSRLKTVEARSDAFDVDTNSAEDVHGLCPLHRLAAKHPGLINEEEADEVGDACPADPDGLHFPGCGCEE